MWELPFVQDSTLCGIQPFSTFFSFFVTFGRGKTGSLAVSCFLVRCFSPGGHAGGNARLVGQSHWHRKQLWLKTSPLFRRFHLLHWTVFGKNHFVPPPSQWYSEAETSCRIPAGAQPGYGRVNWVIHAQQRMCFLAGLESGEHTGGACLGLMKWLGWSRGQKWFQVPLRNMEAILGESLWEGGHCSALVQHLTPQALDLWPITWAPWDCFCAESGKPNCSPLGMQ